MAVPSRPAGVAGAKAELRSALLARRRTVAGTVASSAWTVPLLVRRGSGPVAAYAPIGSEPGGADLPDVLAAAGAAGPVRVLLPVLLADNDLDWTVRSPRHAGPGLGVDAVRAAGLVVVPALAVDRLGRRLGRGGGSYDRALARVPAGVPVVALLYDGELLDRLPAEPHDRPVTAVITPTDGWLDLS